MLAEVDTSPFGAATSTRSLRFRRSINCSICCGVSPSSSRTWYSRSTRMLPTTSPLMLPIRSLMSASVALRLKIISSSSASATLPSSSTMRFSGAGFDGAIRVGNEVTHSRYGAETISSPPKSVTPT